MIKETFLHNRRWLYIIAFLFLAGLFYWDALRFDRVLQTECLVAEVANFKVVQDGLFNWDFPLWMSNYHGGIPFFANAQNAVLHYNVLLGIISPSYQGGCNLGILVNTALAGIFIFYLLLYLGLRERNAFISGVIYMFSGFAITHAVTIQSRYSVYAWTPMMFLVIHKALNHDRWLKNSIVAGIVLAVMGHSSGFDFFLYAASVIIPIVTFMYLLGQGVKKRIVRVFLVGCVVGLAFFGLMAIKLLPLLEWGEVSSKGKGFSYEESIGGHLQFKTLEDFYTLFINPPGKWVEHSSYASLGPITVILLLLSIPYWRKKSTITFLLVAVAGILIGAGTYLYYPLWKFVPGIAAGHHVDRFLFLFQFGMSVLAGFGSVKLFEIVERRVNAKSFFVGLVILLFISSAFISAYPIHKRKSLDLQYSLDNNNLLGYLSEQKGIFRIHNFKTNTIAGFAGMYAIFNDLEVLYGTSPVWVFDYLNEYLSVAYNNPAKFYGMLNTKYLYADEELNVPGLKYAKTFEKCSNCFQDYGTDKGIDGPYLYENEEFLPRAYFPTQSVLIIGNPEEAKKLMYQLMLLDSFNPRTTILVMGESNEVADYSSEFLARFKGVILTNGAEFDREKLSSFLDGGGILLPDVLQSKTSFNEGEVSSLFAAGNDSFYEPVFAKYSADERVIDAGGRKGFIQLSEKFYLFPFGWRAYLDGTETKIYRSNGVNSAIYANGENDLVLEYAPDSFKTGMWITLVTITAVVILLFVYRSKKNMVQ